MDYYWEIVKRDGSTVEVVPSAVEVIRRRWDAGEPIHFPDMTIPAQQIVDFRRTSKPYGQPLIEAAAQAFREPQIFDTWTGFGYTDKTLECKWVKKEVTKLEHSRHYAPHPAYRKLGESGGLIVVAFRLPLHLIDIQKVSYCTDDEVANLEKS